MRKSSVNNILSKAGGLYAGARGFSLVEMLIAMAVGMVVLGAMYSVFTIQDKTFANQENFVEMQQSVRAGMDMMAREIMMAGYDPAGVNSDANPSNDFSGVTVNASQLQIREDIADLNGDGDTGDENENIVYIYKYYDENSDYPYQIKRKTGDGSFQPFVENVQSFTFQYLDGAGNVTTVSANVRRIRITITGRTAKPDPAYPANGGYRTYTLTSIAAPRNLAY
ncbi:MAG: prepilin-type N-terminal cleavage/methylation domain-containing protein [Syntrophales bacterium]|nr:prepilin-type N-terminal cleavage/methylation domain-containing protein [Syntrophales bacterium]